MVVETRCARVCGAAAAQTRGVGGEVYAGRVCGGGVCYTGREHAFFAEAGVDDPGVGRDVVTPVVGVVVVFLFSAALFFVFAITDGEWLTMGRVVACLLFVGGVVGRDG